MGSNGPKYDLESATNAKTTKQLQQELVEFEQGLANLHGDYLKFGAPFYTNHIAFLKMKIAERIGNKK